MLEVVLYNLLIINSLFLYFTLYISLYSSLDELDHGAVRVIASVIGALIGFMIIAVLVVPILPYLIIRKIITTKIKDV